MRSAAGEDGSETPHRQTVTALRVYPVKSLGGVDVQEAHVEPWGLRHDRRWLVFEPDGTVLTAREEHTMLGVTATPRDDRGIELTSRTGSTLRVDAPVGGEAATTTLSRLESVRCAGREADSWVSDELRRPVRLGWLDDPGRRTVSREHGGRAGDRLSLADAGPLLLTAETSLQQLNAWIAETKGSVGRDPPDLAMIRFRPNVVVQGTSEPFVEDAWMSARIGVVTFRVSERCDRCVLTTIDPESLTVGKEPLRTLAHHRRWEGKTWFGIRLVPIAPGTIRVGDPVAGERALEAQATASERRA